MGKPLGPSSQVTIIRLYHLVGEILRVGPLLKQGVWDIPTSTVVVCNRHVVEALRVGSSFSPGAVPVGGFHFFLDLGQAHGRTDLGLQQSGWPVVAPVTWSQPQHTFRQCQPAGYRHTLTPFKSSKLLSNIKRTLTDKGLVSKSRSFRVFWIYVSIFPVCFKNPVTEGKGSSVGS